MILNILTIIITIINISYLTMFSAMASVFMVSAPWMATIRGVRPLLSTMWILAPPCSKHSTISTFNCNSRVSYASQNSYLSINCCQMK